ncbi:MAG: hypothetical protein EOM50_23365 [Erysipelotrichia bacterium]|nr:hypothetical protein [Erysipelotrichia bacterium]
MRKYLLPFGISIFIMMTFLIWHVLANRQPSVSCESQYDLTLHINESGIHSQGLLSADFSNNSLFITFDGLLVSNDKKYIISRSIVLTLEKYNDNRHLSHISGTKIIRHNTDNVPDDIAQQTLFSTSDDDKIIYINFVNDDTILFGNQTRPQYGCRYK